MKGESGGLASLREIQSPSLQDLENQLIRPNGNRRRRHRPEKMRRQPAVQRDHALLLQDQSRALEDACVLLSAVGHGGLAQSGANNLFNIRSTVQCMVKNGVLPREGTRSSMRIAWKVRKLRSAPSPELADCPCSPRGRFPSPSIPWSSRTSRDAASFRWCPDSWPSDLCRDPSGLPAV